MASDQHEDVDRASPSRFERTRLLAALAITPFLAGAAMWVIFVLDFAGPRMFFVSYGSNPLDAALSVAAGTWLLALPATPILAGPAAVYVRRRWGLTWWRVTGGGALIGVTVGAVLAALLTASGDVREAGVVSLGGAIARTLAVGSLVGSLTAGAFWVLGVSGSDRR